MLKEPTLIGRNADRANRLEVRVLSSWAARSANDAGCSCKAQS